MSPQPLHLTWHNKDKALIPTESGKYGYTWVEPNDPRCVETRALIYDDYVTGHQTPLQDGQQYSQRAHLTPQTDNLLICGESGDVLKSLVHTPELAKKYLGNIKLVYIDPPFNTTRTFAHYEDNLEHSIWLTMMRDRLLNLKKLLRPDGSIWVHLDDSESHRMRLLLDEVFGANNFITEITWERVDNAAQRGSAGIVASHDYIAVYARDVSLFQANKKPVAEVPSHFTKQDENGNWYCLRTLRKTGSDSTRESSPNLWFDIESPTGEKVFPIKANGSEGRWRWSRKKVTEDYAKIDWVQERNGKLGPFTRIYFSADKGVTFHNTWRYEDTGSNRISKAEISSLFPDLEPFSTPKPERLLERIIHIGTKPVDIVLDVFAGSGTTAAVAQKMGRRWVTCELLEDTFTHYTLPRLQKVINDQDPGGITYTAERTTKEHTILPPRFSPDDLHAATKLLNALNKTGELTEEQAGAVSTIKNIIATAPSRTRNWRGGGGFHIAHLSPSDFG